MKKDDLKLMCIQNAEKKKKLGQKKKKQWIKTAPTPQLNKWKSGHAVQVTTPSSHENKKEKGSRQKVLMIQPLLNTFG